MPTTFERRWQQSHRSIVDANPRPGFICRLSAYSRCSLFPGRKNIIGRELEIHSEITDLQNILVYSRWQSLELGSKFRDQDVTTISLYRKATPNQIFRSLGYITCVKLDKPPMVSTEVRTRVQGGKRVVVSEKEKVRSNLVPSVSTVSCSDCTYRSNKLSLTNQRLHPVHSDGTVASFI